MRKLLTVNLIILILVTILITPSLVIAGGGSPFTSSTGGSSLETILVKFNADATASDIASAHRQNGAHVKGTIPEIGVQVVTVDGYDVAGKVKGYLNNPHVVYAEPDYECQVVGTPDDTYFGMQWGLEKIQASQAWDTTTGSYDVNIAVLDTGIDMDHMDLADKIIASHNFSSSSTSDDIYGHGTHVAGIAAATTNNTIGVAGVGYNSTLMNVKVMGDSGSGYYSWITAGVIWAADNGAEVINMSLGGTSGSLALKDAIDYAWSKGVVVVAAAGNSGTSTPFYPAAYENCIAVAATDSGDNLASWSNYGDWVDVAAPGLSIYSTLRNNSYGYMSGTSMASPFTAGLAGLVLTTVTDTNGDGNLNDEARASIESGCDDIGVSGIGAGRINAADSVGSEPIVPGSIAGIVTVNADGIPISGATVSAGSYSSVTDADGAYLITGVFPGTQTVTAVKNGYESGTATVTVDAGETATADFALETLFTTGSIAGIVTDADTHLPITGVLVSSGEYQSRTDENGNYILENIPAGVCVVTATADGYVTESWNEEVAAGATTTVNFALTSDQPQTQAIWVQSIDYSLRGKNLFIAVTVVGENGAMDGVEVSLEVTTSGDSWFFTGITDSAGLITEKIGKAPGGSYTVTITDLNATDYIWDPDHGVSSIYFSL